MHGLFVDYKDYPDLDYLSTIILTAGANQLYYFANIIYFSLKLKAKVCIDLLINQLYTKPTFMKKPVIFTGVLLLLSSATWYGCQKNATFTDNTTGTAITIAAPDLINKITSG